MTVYTSKISVSSVFKQNLGRNDVKKTFLVSDIIRRQAGHVGTSLL